MKGVYILASSPITQIKMITVPWDSTYSDVVKFTNTTNQYNYMNGRTGSTMFSNAQYVRKNETYRMPYSFDECFNFNYIMYNNGEGKGWEYAFIKEHIFVSMESTDIVLEYDIYQNNLFKMNVHQCFVEREIVANDGIGEHTLFEDIEMGEFIVVDEMVRELKPEAFAILVTEKIDIDEPSLPSTVFYWYEPDVYGGAVTPCYVLFGLVGNHTADFLKAFAGRYSIAGKKDSIISMFMLPCDDDGYFFSLPINIFDGKVMWNTTRKTSITPKNNKLLTGQFTKLILSSPTAISELHFEKFANYANRRINITYSFGVDSAVFAYPEDYDGVSENIHVGVSATGFQQIPWVNDAFLNWIAQNKAGHTWSILKGVGGALAGAAITAVGAALAPVSGGASLAIAAGGVATAVGSITKTVGDVSAQRKEASVLPDTLGGVIPSNSVIANRGLASFKTQTKTLKAEHATRIDNYFSMFGYQINTVKSPDMTSRPQWNFVKTVGAKISNVPEEDRHALQNAFDNGIRFWHNPANIYNFNLTNK